MEPTTKAMAAEEVEAFPHERRGYDVEGKAGHRDRVGGEAGLDQPVADDLASLGSCECDAAVAA